MEERKMSKDKMWLLQLSLGYGEYRQIAVFDYAPSLREAHASFVEWAKREGWSDGEAGRLEQWVERHEDKTDLDERVWEFDAMALAINPVPFIRRNPSVGAEYDVRVRVRVPKPLTPVGQGLLSDRVRESVAVSVETLLGGPTRSTQTPGSTRIATDRVSSPATFTATRANDQHNTKGIFTNEQQFYRPRPVLRSIHLGPCSGGPWRL
jgi:hypothetical protein